MKQKFLFSILFCCISFSVSAQNRYRQTFSNFAAIDFPGKPRVMDTLGQKIYSYTGDSASYTVILRDDRDVSQILQSESDLDEYYDGMIEGILKAEKSKLIAKTKIQFESLKGMQIECLLETKKNLPNLKFTRLILLNSKIIVIDYSTLSEYRNLTENDRATFFNSLQLLERGAVVNQYNVPDKIQSHSTAYMLGRITGFLLLVLLVGGIIYFVAKK